MDYMKKLDQELEAKMKTEGVTFTYPDRAEFAKATIPAYEAIYEVLGDKARTIVNSIRKIK